MSGIATGALLPLVLALPGRDVPRHAVPSTWKLSRRHGGPLQSKNFTGPHRAKCRSHGNEPIAQRQRLDQKSGLGLRQNVLFGFFCLRVDQLARRILTDQIR